MLEILWRIEEHSIMTVAHFSIHRKNWILVNLLNLFFNNLGVPDLSSFLRHSENYLLFIIKLTQRITHLTSNTSESIKIQCYLRIIIDQKSFFLLNNQHVYRNHNILTINRNIHLSSTFSHEIRFCTDFSLELAIWYKFNQKIV